MAKTLVALYDTFTDAEQVVQELIADGFSRSDIHLALDHTKSSTAHTSSVEWDSAYEGVNLLDTLVDLGVPYDEAQAYAREVIKADLEIPGDDDVFRKIRRDFDAKSVEKSDHQIRSKMVDLMGVAISQIEAEAKN